MRVPAVLALCVILAGCASPAGPAPPEVLALRCDPCALDAGDGGDAFEPDLALDPSDPGHLVVAQTPFGPEGRGLAVHSSRDGGTTWQVRRLDAQLPLCTTYADAGVEFGPDGTLWVAALAIGTLPTRFGEGARAVVAFPSSDGGQTWGPAVVVWPPAPRTPCAPAWPEGASLRDALPDMTRFASAPGGDVVLTWRHLDVGGGPAGIALARAGGTWPVSVLAMDGGDDECQATGPQPGFARDGTLHLATLRWGAQGAEGVCFLASDDLASVDGQDMGDSGLAWPRFVQCGKPHWVTARGDQVLLWTLDGRWTARPVQGLAHSGAPTPSVACIGTEPLVTGFTDRGLVAAMEQTTLLLDADIVGHDMATRGMGHYMDAATQGDGAWVVWVGGEQGRRQVRVAHLWLGPAPLA